MSDFNFIAFTGRLTRDVEMKATQGGTFVSNMSVACNRKYKDKVILCWEKDPTNCHRRMLAKWLEDNLKISIPEYKVREKQFSMF